MPSISDWIFVIACIGGPIIAAVTFYITMSSPMSLERMIGVMVVVIFGAGVVIISVQGKPWAWVVGLAVFLATCAFLFVMDRFGVGAKIWEWVSAAVPERWRRKPLPEDYVGPADRYLRLDVSEGALRTFRRRRFRDDQLLEASPLAGVRHIHWYVSGFSRVGTIRVTLWDRASAFEQVFVDAVALDKTAHKLGEFRAPDLLAHPDAHRAFLEHFQPLINLGFVTSTVDIATLRPLAPSTETTMAGVVQIGNKLIYDPHLARTERQMREEETDQI